MSCLPILLAVSRQGWVREMEWTASVDEMALRMRGREGCYFGVVWIPTKEDK